MNDTFCAGIKPLIIIFHCLFSVFMLATQAKSTSLEERLHEISLPAGFSIHIYAQNVYGARSMTISPAGTLYVGTRTKGKVYAVVDSDRDFKADRIITIASGLNMPNGVAYAGDSLYVAEVNRVLRYKDIERNLTRPMPPVVVNDSFPADRSHGWKYIAFGPDGLLYVPVGFPCNVCAPEDKRYGTINRMTQEGTNLEIYARGIRNTVGFDWHPVTKDLWFTNNGRDWMGDDLPPDTLHKAPHKNINFGFPYCHAGYIPDPEFGDRRKCDEFAGPALKLGAHVAPLGMKFYTGDMFPRQYKNRIFIAEHGSWNRTVPVGYRITQVRLENDTATTYEVFAQGWLQGDDAWGRPVDILILPDGSMLVSDDRADAIYRITYRK